jgi:hypothetical protein
MATDIKLKDYTLYKYKERIKEKKDSLYYMLSIISSGNRGCCSSTVPIHEPPRTPALVNEVLIGFPHALQVRLIDQDRFSPNPFRFIYDTVILDTESVTKDAKMRIRKPFRRWI